MSFKSSTRSRRYSLLSLEKASILSSTASSKAHSAQWPASPDALLRAGPKLVTVQQQELDVKISLSSAPNRSAACSKVQASCSIASFSGASQLLNIQFGINC